MIDPTVLRQLCEQATPGPWYTGTLDAHIVFDRDYILTEGSLQGPNRHNAERNAAFIAAAREALPQLLDENAALRERVDEAEKENEVLASAVRACAEETTGYLGAIETIAAIEAKVREYCIRDEVTGVEEEFRYVTHDEDGEPIVEANTLPDAVAQLLGLSEHLHEQCAVLESRLAALTAAGEKVVEARGPWGKSGSCRCWNREKCPSCDSEIALADALDAFSGLLRSDP